MVRRPRLVSQIAAGTRHHKLSLLSAPPGFGKTTALAEWAAGDPGALAWISLDEGDNDPARFLAYLFYSLAYHQITCKETIELLPSMESVPPIIGMERLIENLESVPEPFTVVLDDYHLITSPAVHDCMVFLLDHLPSTMHLVIATRSDPPISLARLRTRQELVEIRADDLRFTEEETAAFLENILGLSIRPEEIRVLEARTEGWIAGLQLAALSMRGREDLHGFIQAFSGTHHFILDYLIDEVISRQPEPIQRFLLFTSILERLSGPLCDSLFEGNEPGGQNPEGSPFSSQSILAYLEKSNLFLVPLDDERHWFRYHHLFAELLRAQLKQRMPGRIAGLHLQAAAWFEQHEFWSEAAEHLLSAEAFERAAQLVERYGQERWSFSDLTFLMLISRLPHEILLTHPKSGVYYAWMLITQGQLEPAEALLHQIMEQFHPEPGDAEAEGMRGFVQLLFVYIDVLRGKTGLIRLPGRSVLEVVPEQFLAMRNSADVIYAMLLSFQGDFEQAMDILLQTVQRDLAAGGTTATPISIALCARLLTLQGRLHEAADLCRKYTQVVAERGSWRFYLAGDLNIVLGEILREWNELDEAEREIRAGMRLNAPWNVAQGTAVGYTALARILYSRGFLAEAMHTLAEAEQLISGKILTPDLASEFRSLRIYFELAQRDLSQAEGWAERLPANRPGDFRTELDFILLARLRILQRRYSEAVELLQALDLQARAGKRNLRRVKIGLLWAQALQGQEKTSESLEKLESCLALAEKEGMVRTFLDEGEPILELLSAYARSLNGKHREYAQKLLNSFSNLPAGKLPTTAQPGLAEPLTPREMEILKLICTGLSNQEIAAQLVITLNTVKRHNNSIFSKLGVTNRAQAILRAQQAGLIQIPDQTILP